MLSKAPKSVSMIDIRTLKERVIDTIQSDVLLSISVELMAYKDAR